MPKKLTMLSNKARTVIGQTLALSCLGALLVASAFAQDEPIRLEKKSRPEAKTPAKEPAPADGGMKKQDEKKPAPKSDLPKEDAIPLSPEELEKMVQETINRLSKNLHVVEDRLRKKDPGESTQKTQKDIIKDLDELIDQVSQAEDQMQQTDQQQQGQQGQQRRQQKMSQKGKQSKLQRMMQAQRQKGRRQRDQMAQLQRNQNQGQRQPGQQQPDQQNQPNGDNPPFGDAAKKDYTAKTAELYKDVWGHLPEALRQEMSQYTREQFMAKYNELLKQYYATIAEKGRKQPER